MQILLHQKFTFMINIFAESVSGVPEQYLHERFLTNQRKDALGGERNFY